MVLEKPLKANFKPRYFNQLSLLRKRWGGTMVGSYLCKELRRERKEIDRRRREVWIEGD